MKKYWDYRVWNQWRANILKGAFTVKDLNGTYPEYYDSVIKITDDVQYWNIEPTEIRKVVRIEKDGERYLFPILYEDRLPAVITDSIECQLKPSEKTVYKYIKQVTTKNIPQSDEGETFKQFIDQFNDMDVSDLKTWTFLKILTIACKSGSIFIALCGPPSMGKNANFTLLGLILPGIHRVGTPSAARLYDELCKNDVLVVDEITNSETDDLRGIEKYILPMTDGDPNFTKPKMPKGKQPRELDMTKKSLIFTYNRVQDVNKRRIWIDYRWGTPDAMSSRFPQLLLSNEMLGKRPVFTIGSLNKTLADNDEVMKKIAKQASYWTQNMHKHMHNYNRDLIKDLSTRHYSCISPLIDAIDVYSESQEEFNTWMKFILNSMENYQRMLKGDEVLSVNVEVVKVK